MSLTKRFALIFKSKAHKALDKAENPAETLDYSYERQLELLRKSKAGLTDVATARKRVEMQATDLAKQAQKLQEQAEKAIAAGREDLAREALTRKAALMPQVEALRAQHDSLTADEEKLSAAVQTLTAKVEAFRTRKETVKATYAAAKAQSQIAESFAGIGGEFEDVGLALQRAEDKTAQMQARGAAIDELVSSGALDDPLALSTGQDSISRELDALSASSTIEAELAALKGAVGAGSAPRELR
jgi:phage shock protein A